MKLWLSFQAVFQVLPDNIPIRMIYYNFLTFGLGSMCFKEKVTILHSYGLLITQPLLLLFFIFVFWACAQSTAWSKLLQRMQRRASLLHVLWLVILWSYSSIAFTAFALLNCVDLDGKKVLFSDGSVECFVSKEHAPYFTFAIVLMVTFVAALPLLLLRQTFRVSPRLIGFMDEASHVYRDDCRWWCSVNLLRRLIFASLAASSSTRDTRQLWMGITAIFLLGMHASFR